MTYIKADSNVRSPSGRKNSAIVGASTATSLQFLHKPQRVSQMNKDRFPEEELLRNTQLNKNIHSRTVDSNYEEYVSETSRGGNSPVEEFEPLSPKSTLPGLDTMNLDGLTDDSMVAPFSPPVYKKSGELVKSSLKRRSKSLPSTPGLNAPMHVSVRAPNKLVRSKSVHFDQKAPVRYFNKNERPIDVSNADIYDQYGSYTGDYSDEPRNKADEISAMMQNMSLDQKTRDRLHALEMESRRVENNGTAPPQNNNNNNNNNTKKDKKLRKSKRFAAIQNKEGKSGESDKENNDNDSPSPVSSSDNSANSSQTSLKDIINGQKPVMNTFRSELGPTMLGPNQSFFSSGNVQQHQQHRVVGLYNENFPILSNKNPKSLKLNIFINLSQKKEVFLQELSLHIHRERAFFSPGSGIDNGTPMNTRLLSGRVLVRNIFFDKRVVIRYTWNGWRTVGEVECVWVSDGDGVVPGGSAMDVFHFVIDDASKWAGKARIEFCIQYTTRDDIHRLEFWDNNCGKNYSVDLVMDGFRNPFANALR
ncbi:GLC7-interacting protein 2 [Nakaseomyces bracarensis]|uniref:GLC7-interacting protein 2 n=1 Tax=Nakaseomyces bracarensis TaxID=273131 RepID=A0ABR4NW54_9SACH